MATDDGTVDFKEIHQPEHNAINQRRKKLGRSPISEYMYESKTGGRPVYDTIGLALSGGGIRSAAFCLGVLQGLDKVDVLKKIDYLSTVSGGGYIGSSLTAGMTTNGGDFPFESKLDDAETASIKHIRDYSNYLIPTGIGDVLSGITIYLRGLVANAILMAPVLLLFAAATIFINPVVSALFEPNFVSIKIPNIFLGRFFVVTRYLLLILLVWLAGWALWRSMPWRIGRGEIKGRVAFVFGLALVIVGFIAFSELQPFVLAGMFNQSNSIFDTIANTVTAAAKYLAPFSVIIAFLAKSLGETLKQASESSGLRKRAIVVATKAALYIAGLALPIILWFVYLELSYWGIFNDRIAFKAGESGYMAPAWMVQVGTYLAAHLGQYLPSHLTPPVGLFYLVAGLGVCLLWLLLDPNANSLHRLYRDRLSKAFLFKPNTEKDETDEPLNQDQLKLSELSTDLAPYHLINSAVNLQSSRYANKRGRNAGFFLFSPKFVGSSPTGYVTTKQMEAAAPALNVATAMAISGAAASSNMGSNTIKWLAPTLAILNVRLGFWLRNPRDATASKVKRLLADVGQHFYFVHEMLGQLNENRWAVYLTDGGHIENLGIYELLRRRCHLIIAVDAEADPEMNFPSFVKLERHARIDLGVRIDLPWQEIRAAVLKVGEPPSTAGWEGTSQPSRGPHCAIGRIHYQDGVEGVLFYIKSSLTGDENDYVLDYRRRYVSFPHETTGDQFFTEEQFEVYRALGFHALYGAFTARDLVSLGITPEARPPATPPTVSSVYATLVARSATGFGDSVVDGILRSLGLPALKTGPQPSGRKTRRK